MDTSGILGKYYSPEQDLNKVTSEYLILKGDSTFEYRLKTEFTKIEANGHWYVSHTNLVLNSDNKKQKMIVQESYDKVHKGLVTFEVVYKDNKPLYYQLYLTTQMEYLIIKIYFMILP